MSRFYQLSGFESGSFDPQNRFVTSWLFPPLLLASCRALLSLYAFITIFFIFGWYDSHNESIYSRESFSYFTSLTYWGLAFYMAFSAAHTFSYALRGRSFISSWPRPLQALHSLYYTTVTTFPFLVTIVFWVILYSAFPNEFRTWSNVSQHALNSAYALFEIVFPATNPPPFLHLAGLVILLLLYLALAYLTNATEGFYPYSFLDPSTGSGKVAGYCFGILAAIIVIFLIVWGLIWLRRKFTGLGKKSKRDLTSAPPPDVEMQVSEK